MKKFTNGYYALGLNVNYSIQREDKVNLSQWGSVDGPFRTLRQAKERVRDWIHSDRVHLSNELYKINLLKEKDI